MAAEAEFEQGSAAAGESETPALPAPAKVAPPAPSEAGSSRRRVMRPRIDIDDQIREANRVSDLLKKMGQAAKTLKKSQTRAKQRLIKKATRLNPQDLERIAVPKRVLNEPQEQDGNPPSSASSSSATVPPPAQGALDLHALLKGMMKDVSGATDVVEGLGARYTQDAKRGKAGSGAGLVAGLVAAPAAGPAEKKPKRLSSLRRLPSDPNAGETENEDIHEDSQVSPE